jgi:hypothetical protein
MQSTQNQPDDAVVALVLSRDNTLGDQSVQEMIGGPARGDFELLAG